MLLKLIIALAILVLIIGGAAKFTHVFADVPDDEEYGDDYDDDDDDDDDDYDDDDDDNEPDAYPSYSTHDMILQEREYVEFGDTEQLNIKLMTLRLTKPHLFEDDWYDKSRKEFSLWAVEQAQLQADWMRETIAA